MYLNWICVNYATQHRELNLAVCNLMGPTVNQAYVEYRYMTSQYDSFIKVNIWTAIRVNEIIMLSWVMVFVMGLLKGEGTGKQENGQGYHQDR